MRRAPSPPLTAADFIKLNHASFYADPVFMVDALSRIFEELKTTRPAGKAGRPRLLLAGPNLARSDYKILDMAEEAGGEIVIEEISECVRYYWNRIADAGNLLESLARGYLRERVPCAFMRSSTKKRFDFIVKLIADFNVAGVIWYELQCCETYDQESFFLQQRLQERNIPMLVVESNYDTSDTGQLRTRVQAFMELLEGGANHA